MWHYFNRSFYFHDDPYSNFSRQAYIGADGKPRLFRPDLNMKRLETSAARMALPVSNPLKFTYNLLTLNALL